MARIEVATIEEVPAGEVRVFDVGGRSVAVCNVAGAFYAIDNSCPHRGGPLGEGDLDGAVVICPWHGWRWDVTTGANTNNPASRVPCFPVSVERGEILVELP